MIYIKSDGFPYRLPEKVRKYVEASYKIEGLANECSGVDLPLNIDPMGKCHLGVKNKAPTVLLLGDSFSEAIAGSFDTFLEQNNQSGIAVKTAGCPPIVGIGSWVLLGAEARTEVQNNTYKIIDEWNIQTVVLYARWPVFEWPSNFKWIKVLSQENFEQTLNNAFDKMIVELQKRNVKIVVFKSAPIFTVNIPIAMARRELKNKKVDISMPLQAVIDSSQVENRMFSRYDNNPNILFIDLKDQFCLKGICHASHDKKPIYFDEGHFNLYGAQLLLPAYEGMKPFLNWAK